jgi:hypothetical protein
MKKSLILITFILATASITFGQEYYRPSVNTTSSSFRHEIIQAAGPNILSVTLRLDKYTGRVFWLSTCPQRNIIGIVPCWKETTVLELPKPANDNTVKFQIFVHGEDKGRNILLINNVSGQTWQLGIEDGLYKWTPFTDSVTLPQSFEIVR